MTAVVDTPTGARWHAASVSGPASYAAGGFEVDMTGTLSVLGYLEPIVTTRGVLPGCMYEVTLNRDSTGAVVNGKAMVKVMRLRYDKATHGAVTGTPVGVAVPASLSSTGGSGGSGHNHSIAHDHPNTTSSVNNTGGGAVVSAGGGPALSAHTHDVNLANFTGNTSTTGTHSHQRAFEYDHDHSTTTTGTAVAYTEIAAATNLSGVTWKMLVVGF